LTIKFTQSTSAASGRMFNFRDQACAWLRPLTHQLPEKFYDLCACSSRTFI
jgi:hypothetical protein